MSSDVELNLKQSEAETRERRRLQREWWRRLVAHPDASLHRHIEPGEYIVFGADNQKCLIEPGLILNYSVWQDRCEVDMRIEDQSNARLQYEPDYRPQTDWEIAVYNGLLDKRDQIEASFGESLDWLGMEWIIFHVDGGYMSPEREWDEIISRQVNGMNRLYAALLPHVDGIRPRALK